MKLSLSSTPLTEVKTPCLVIAATEDGPLSPSAQTLDKATDGQLGRMLESRDINTSTAKTTMLHGLTGLAADRVLVIGLGKPEKLTAARWDRACLAAGKALRDHPITECHIFAHDVEVEDVDETWRLRQMALCIQRANYLYTTTKRPKDDDSIPLRKAVFNQAENGQSALDQASGMAVGFLKARDLGDLPPNICNPAYLAQEARQIADSFDKVNLEVLEEAEMAELGMDALLGVSRGSANGAKLIVLKYSGGADSEDPVVFVGKGITFDTGGISLKPGANMDQMKYDMCGAAGVLGAFLSCAKLDLPINLVCIVPAVENMPDGDAYRPGDVLTSMSGKTIEVLNTDAEGRLILCDALTYAERFNPRHVIDAATLTGACVVALGHHASGLMSNDDELAGALVAAGDRCMDRAWRLPIWEEYMSQLETPFADMKNVGGMPAGAITAGCFLSRFTKKQSWAHLDVAGSAWKWGETEGSTGRPVGLLTQFLIDLAA
ncbi:MAG TPA: leucyl aminopeptidase [Xanthomonadales bacterium]|nr:leucyl aminopeptidase [Xanthomonadales bacterium]